MIGLEDRQAMVRHIETTHAAGARLHKACEVAGVSVRTLERWKAWDGLTVGDRRPEAERPPPARFRKFRFVPAEEERSFLPK